MAKLSTHVLDLTLGKPGSGMKIQLLREGTVLHSFETNADGRTDQPLLEGEACVPGRYELRFHVRAYFQSQNQACPFLNVVPIAFEIAEGESYHVPLLCSPWSYSTYRGS